MPKVRDKDDEGLKTEQDITKILISENQSGLSKKYHCWSALYGIIDKVWTEVE